jgi:hypothetical protein
MVCKANIYKITSNKNKVITELPTLAEFTKFAIRVTYARYLLYEAPEFKSLLIIT